MIKNNKNTDNDLIKLFNDYQKEEINILRTFVQCFRLFEQDIENENKFIFVEESFFKNMGIDILKKKIREIHVDKNHKYIIFNNTDKRIGFKEIDNILYKFVESGVINSIMNDNDTSKIIINDKELKIKKNETNSKAKKGDNNNEISNNENNHENENNIGNENNNGNENKDIKSNIKNSLNTNNELVKDEIIDVEEEVYGHINE